MSTTPACLLSAGLVATGALFTGPARGQVDELIPAELLTVAEQSDFRRTARHAEVVALCERIAARSERVVLTELGKSYEGRSLPLLVLSDPPVHTAAEAHATKKPIVLAFGNIHAGEVCGKEALLMLARELALDPGPTLLSDVVLVLAPIYNADGNERMSPTNRPGQVGPDEMGERPNAQGLDLNRDWIKLEAPETRALVAFLNAWDPALVIDTHTTNGSQHRYVLTYAPPLCPAGDPGPAGFVREVLLPTVSRRLRERTGYDTFLYGNFDAGHTRWSTYSGDPRFGGPYRGLRGTPSVLTEAYAFATFEDRVRSTLEFVRETLAFVSASPGREELLRVWTDARRRYDREPTPEERAAEIPLRFELATSGKTTLRGWTTTDPREPYDWEVEHFDHFAPTLRVSRPKAYAVPPELAHVIANLEQHGIALERLVEPRQVTVELYRVSGLERAENAFQGHRPVQVEVEAARAEERTLPAGTALVPTWQPLGNLACFLLEPAAQDGLAVWNFCDADLEVGADHPIARLPW